MKNKELLYGFIGLVLGGILVGVALGMSRPQETIMPQASTMDNNDMKTTMSDMSQGLADKSGAELEEEFLNSMIIHHQGAIDMAQMFKIGSNRPELRQLADDIIAAQTKEIEMMRQWLSQWF